ncbi:uncharacterized protein BCR38DRAFT_435341 [Pseudomassariella vexata]|uniref:Zn(2)-C6 fungal-type domain-containing protein n=1 Tax=Pseudomassariella vexata TaxID=1141098 RepID=A0A1Y2E0X6_9PEZI|nr:uncharacterized protein BCR38DRAFT_435341 [Pseudomassariella vexata]ORY64515.1 hypothetical protein BCR38DRAFT_435341 [Pseudomassariella vexata]
MPKRYPSILPAQPGDPVLAPPPGSEAGSSTAPSPSRLGLMRELPQRKRVGTQLACNACRKSKTRCDGHRPCVACRRRTSECVYAERPVDDKTELLTLLKSMPEPQAFDLLLAYRAMGDPAAVLSSVRESQSRSKEDEPITLVTTSLAALEDELKTRNHVSYPRLPPIPALLSESVLLQPVRSAPIHSKDQQDMADSISRSQPEPDGTDTAESSGFHPRTVANPFRIRATPDDLPASYCDERLTLLDISYWTDVVVADEFAARVISLYLETDHPLLGFFDPDLFITDLVSKQHRFCSRFLVHALLYWGCQMYSAIDQDANVSANSFCEEALLLWNMERNTDSLLNIAGAVLLSLSFIGHGKDHGVLEYSAAAARMAARLGLFGMEDIPDASRKTLSNEEQSASCYAAWGITNWTTFLSLFYRQPGLPCPKHPPTLPIPGKQETASSQEPSNSSNITLRQEPVLPRYMGKTFPALCEFWQILQGVTMRYYQGTNSPVPAHSDLEYAEFKFRELLAWAENLPSELQRAEDNPHHVVILHLWLHAAILDIFRPFIHGLPAERNLLKTFGTRSASAGDVYNASVNQLKRLIITFRSNYVSSTYTILWHTALTYLANAMLQGQSDPEWHVYFLLCIYGYEGLRRPYRISELIAQGLLSMTMRDSDISGAEARRLLGHMRENGSSLDHIQGKIRATFMADLNLAMKDPEAARVENLAEKFEEMVLFLEYINFDIDSPMKDSAA